MSELLNNPNVIPPKHINAVLILLSVNIIVKAVLNYDQLDTALTLILSALHIQIFRWLMWSIWIAVYLRPVYSDTTQLNSTSSWVELRRYKRAFIVSGVHGNLSSSAQVNNSYNTQSSGVDTELYEKSKYFTDTPM